LSSGLGCHGSPVVGSVDCEAYHIARPQAPALTHPQAVQRQVHRSGATNGITDEPVCGGSGETATSAAPRR
jgi:hypothetical protein